MLMPLALTPLKKRIHFECVCLLSLLSIPLISTEWEYPTVWTLGLMGDSLSNILLLLTLWTSALMLLLKPEDGLAKLNVILLMLSLLAFFSVTSLLLFFVFFEASLIPTLFLVLGWGYQPERVEASAYFVFYTVSLSTPLLVSLIWLSSSTGSKYFYFDELYEVCSGCLGFMILAVLLVKLPIFMLHLWLPKAHVEAPVIGSMILAGVLLKTGGYGVIRMSLYMEKSVVTLGFLALGLLGMAYVCLVCLYCTDLKQLIAYSSVSHMNFMVVGLMNNCQVSYSGCIIMMVSHGLCSSLMFMLADISYSRCNSRSILINKGLLTVLPSLAMLWGLASLFNMGVPPTGGSLSELLVISSSLKSSIHGVMFSLYLFLSAFYSVFLYMAVNHGNSGISTYTLNGKEVLLSVAHLTPLASLTFAGKLLMMW